MERVLAEQENPNFALPSPPTKAERLISLMDTLILFIENKLANKDFQKKCSEIVGMNGYLLYTVDRIVTGCIHQLRAILEDRTMMLQMVGRMK